MSGMDGYNHWGEALTNINQYYVTTDSSSNITGYSGYGAYTVRYTEPVVQWQQPENPWVTIQQTPMWQHGWSDEDIKNKSKEAAQIADGWDPDENI